jgi:hypothetical protein
MTDLTLWRLDIFLLIFLHVLNEVIFIVLRKGADIGIVACYVPWALGFVLWALSMALCQRLDHEKEYISTLPHLSLSKLVTFVLGCGMMVIGWFGRCVIFLALVWLILEAAIRCV